MRIAIIFISLLFSIQSFGQTQSTLPAGAFPLSSQSYRSPNGDVWIGRDGMYYNVGSKAKTDSVFALIKVRDISQGANIVINKTNPNNWVISSTGGGTGSADWGLIGGDIADQSDLLDSLNSRLSLAVFDPEYNSLSGDQLLRYDDVTGKWGNFSPSWILPGSNISLLNNNAGYAVIGSGAAQVRSNSDLDSRYLQSESDPTIPQYVKDIATGDISNWNSKISSVTGGVGITVDATDPYNLVVNSDGGSSITLTGDVTGTGEGTIVTSIGDNAVTTAKINNAAVTLPKLQNISRGRLLGLGGGGTNTWVYESAWGSTGILYEWAPNIAYSNGSYALLGSNLYQASGTPSVGVPPPNSPWVLVTSQFMGIYDSKRFYNTNDRVAVVNTGIYRTTAPIGGIAPTATPVNTPGAPTQIQIGDNLILGADNVLHASQSTNIAGLIQAGTNVVITGSGYITNPYVISATGGGSGGSVSIFSGPNINVTGNSSTGYTISNTYSLPTGSASVKGGFRVGSGLSVSGDVLSATGTSASVFTKTVAGLVPAPGGSTSTRYLREDGTWVVPSGGGGGGGGISALTGDVLASGSGSVTATIANGAVTNAKMANMAGQTIKGRFGSAGAPEDLHNFAVRRIINPVFAISGTTINVQNGSKQYATRTANTTYTMQEFYAGLDLQVEISNSSGGAITISFDGATFPDGVNGSIPAGKTAVFSMAKFQTIIRATKLIY